MTERTHLSAKHKLKEWKRDHPNLANVPGWDERDYELWSQLRQLPSYGLLPGKEGNCAVSRNDVEELLRKAAKKRFDYDWSVER